MTDRIVRFSADVTAADPERRTIVGTVVPYGQVGQTNIGPVMFQKGAIRANDVKLLLEHDGRRPIGRSTSFVDGPERLVGAFKVSGTTAGTDALVEAADGLRDGLSVGANIIDSTVGDDGTLIVTAAELVEVSLVATPAFAGATVSQVAASADDPDEQETPEDAPAPADPEPSEEEDVEETAQEVAAAAVDPTPVVEAARPSQPYITARPRDLDGLTAGGMLRAQLRAQFLGDRDAQTLVTAALGAQSTVNDYGVIPVPLLREIIGVIDNQRPFIDSVARQPLPAAGMSFRIPKVDTKVTVDEQIYENDEVDSTQGVIEDITVDVKTFAGGNTVSRQLIDRADPSYFDELLRQLASAYANKVDAWALATASATAVASTGVDIYTAVVAGQTDAYGVMRFAPDTLHVAPAGTGDVTWAKILAATGQDDRPLFAAGVPSNAAGLVSQGSTNGTVAGLRLVVNPNAPANEQAFVYPSAFATFYESAGAPIRVTVESAANLNVDVSVHGYVALAVKYPTAMRELAIS